MPVSVGAVRRRAGKKIKLLPNEVTLDAIEKAIAVPIGPTGLLAPEHFAAYASMSNWMTSRLFSTDERFQGERIYAPFAGLAAGRSEQGKQLKARLIALQADPDNRPVLDAWDRLSAAGHGLVKLPVAASSK